MMLRDMFQIYLDWRSFSFDVLRVLVIRTVGHDERNAWLAIGLKSCARILLRVLDSINQYSSTLVE